VEAAGIAAFLGHLYPLFLGFRGGKGVATACGVMFVISPLATVLALLVFIVAVAARRYVSLGSMLAASSMPVFLYLSGHEDFVGLGVLIALFIILKHRANIRRLLAGEENRL
jgi:glycerol-3-phosphate acyltransferase PlsY